MHDLTEIDEFSGPITVPDGIDSRSNAAEVVEAIAQALANRTFHLKSHGGNLTSLLNWELRGDVGAYTNDLQGIGVGRNPSSGDRVWIAVGPDQVFRSADHGKSWEGVATPLGNLRAVAYGNGVWVAVGGNSGSPVIFTNNSDGFGPWTARTPGGVPTGYLNAITYAAGGFIAVGQNGEIQLSTNGGVTWTKETPAASHFLSAITYTGSNFVAVGGAGGTAFAQVSIAGVGWTAHAFPANARFQIGVTMHQGKLVSVGYKVGGPPDVGLLYTSTDEGSTWAEEQELGLFGPNCCASLAGFVIVGTNSSNDTAFGSHPALLVGKPGEPFIAVPAPNGQEKSPGGSAGGSIWAIATDGQKCNLSGSYGTLADSLVTV